MLLQIYNSAALVLMKQKKAFIKFSFSNQFCLYLKAPFPPTFNSFSKTSRPRPRRRFFSSIIFKIDFVFMTRCTLRASNDLT